MFKVAAIQMKVKLGEVEENRRKAVQMVEQAAEAGAHFIVLPELWVSGYHLTAQQVMKMKETPLGETVRLFQHLAKKWKMVMVVPFLEEGEDHFYISAAVIERNGDLIGVYRKTFLWGREQHIFTAGERTYPVFTTSIGKIGVLLCYDAEFPEPSRLLALQGAGLLAIPSVWSKTAEDRWDIQLQARALDNTVFVLGANTVGEGSCGKSKLVGPDGSVLRQAGSEEECVLLHEIELSEIAEVRSYIPYMHDYDFTVIPGGQEE